MIVNGHMHLQYFVAETSAFRALFHSIRLGSKSWHPVICYLESSMH